MAESKNLSERFSNDQYLTFNQVTVELRTTLIDSIWKQIIEYRDKFTFPLTIRTVDKNRFIVVLTPKINEKINTIDRKLTKTMANYSAFMQNDDYRLEFNIIQTKNIISNIASLYNVDANESFYQRLVTHNISSLSPSEMILNDYHRALNFLTQNIDAPLDKNFIASLGEIFNALENPNYIFRTQEVKDQSQKALINKLFVAAPVKLIEDMVNDLLDFTQSSKAPPFVVFVAIFFYFSYIKPFSYHSEEIALLLAKGYLQRNDLEVLAPILNLEVLHDQYKEKLDEVMLDVKKTNDLTYLVNFMADMFLKQITQFEELMADVKSQMITNERYQPEEMPAPQPQPQFKTVINNEERFEQQLLPLVEEVKEEFEQKVEIVPVVVPAPQINPTYEAPTTIVHKQDEGVKIETWMDIALPKVPVGLSEEDAQKIETHLREMDPSLSKLEAYFYARHCTVGKYYTISQFKEVTSCAYETARTSMDHLANSGYYRKEKFKNKFLYTPVKR